MTGPQCCKCGYDLSGGGLERCPECGCADPESWPPPRSERVERAVMIGCLTAMLVLLGLGLAVWLTKTLAP